jgi:hypothetical protein
MRNGVIVERVVGGVENLRLFFAQVVEVVDVGVRGFPRGLESCFASSSPAKVMLLPLTLALSPF